MANTKSTTTKTEEKYKKGVLPEGFTVNDLIPVVNGFNGILVYKVRRTGEEIVWDEFGDEQDIELKELRSAKSSDKAFYINNWFMFGKEYEWVPYYLGVGKYYENSISIDEFDELFDKKPTEVKKILDKLPNGQKQSLAFKARYMINNDMIDSKQTIKVLEDILDLV